MTKKKEKEKINSSYYEINKSLLSDAKVDMILNRITTKNDIDGDNDILIGQNAKFSEKTEVDLISDFKKFLNHNQRIIETNDDEIYFTDFVPYIKTNTLPKENITSKVLWHNEDAYSVQIDIYNTIDTNNDKKEFNICTRIHLFGKAIYKYDINMFYKMLDLVHNYISINNKKLKNKKYITFGINIDDTNTDFDEILNIEWNVEKNCMWPKCIREKEKCYIISQKTLELCDIKNKVVNKFQKDDIKNYIFNIAIKSANDQLKSIQSYKLQSSISIQMAEQAKWAIPIGISLVMETCGIKVKDNNLFEMVDIDIPKKTYKLRTNEIGKGDGMPMMYSKAWNIMLPLNSLKSMSRSPMAVANSIIYNYIVYSNELGRLMAPLDNLFMYDYAVENRPEVSEWFSGVRNKIALLFKYMTPLQATSTIGNVMCYEMIKSKCKVEEASRKYSQINKKMAVWKDLRAMLHYRVVDAAFLKIVPFTMLTDDEMNIIGFATVLHDMVDFGYDVSVKESSNTFLTITNGKIDIESVKKGYIRMANGLQYIIEKYKNDACGLTFLATHFWQMSNGRHRIIPSIYNGSIKYQHEYLEFNGELLDVLNDSKIIKKNITNDEIKAGEYIRDVALSLGYDAIELANLVTLDMTKNYIDNTEISPREINIIERKICELSTSLSIGCGVDGKITSFLWMICEYMWLNTGMMLSCLIGTIKIMHNRKQSDDRGGLDYKW